MGLKKKILARLFGAYINTLSFARPHRATQLAYKLFSQPRAGRLVPGTLPEILREAERCQIKQGPFDFHVYIWKGSADQTILLAHGWESNASRWELLLPYLRSTNKTIIAIDGPAHGLSGGTEFNLIDYAFAIHLAVEQFKPTAIIGHSMGGAACNYFMHRYPNSGVEKMVLIGAPSDLRTLLENFATALGLNQRVADGVAQYICSRFGLSINEFSGRLFASTHSIPGLVAHDEVDDVVSIYEAEKIVSGWKHATFIRTRGLGHSMHDEALYGEISRFLFGAKTAT